MQIRKWWFRFWVCLIARAPCYTCKWIRSVFLSLLFHFNMRWNGINELWCVENVNAFSAAFISSCQFFGIFWSTGILILLCVCSLLFSLATGWLFNGKSLSHWRRLNNVSYTFAHTHPSRLVWCFWCCCCCCCCHHLNCVKWHTRSSNSVVKRFRSGTTSTTALLLLLPWSLPLPLSLPATDVSIQYCARCAMMFDVGCSLPSCCRYHQAIYLHLDC